MKRAMSPWFAALIRGMLICSIAIAIFPLRAQTFYGSIVGAVTDSTGAMLPGATVTVINLGTAERRNAVTDASGNYQVVNLVPARYRVDIESSGG
jgi:Carboxypeptidase regulatory-like domain